MNELGPEARALLDVARRVSAPSPEQAERLWSRVRGAIATPASPPNAAIAHAAPAVPTVLAAVLVATALGVAALALRRDPAPAPAPPPATAPALSLAPSASVAPGPSLVPPSSPVSGPQPSLVPSSARPARAAPPPRDVSAPDDGRGDVALVRSAYEALRAGEAARSLTLVDEHARRYPQSVLGEEREATRVLALCELGRADDARAALGAYRRAYPSGLHLQRLPPRCAR
jgi:hypothetical protein